MRKTSVLGVLALMQAYQGAALRSRQALIDALVKVKGASALDPGQAGYVARVADNLVAGVALDQVRPFYEHAAGHELDSKMRAAYSSSALAANSFTPWLAAPGGLSLACQSGFDLLKFEAVCPTGLQGTAPHLDVLAESAGCVVGVESKCLEYLEPHGQQGFAESYDAVLQQYPVLQRAAGGGFVHLNAAQLIKHMLGLMHTYRDKHTTLLYLFWEPLNWWEFPIFGEHRAEVRRFAGAVEGGPVVFRAMTYRQLWDEWSLQAGPAWLEDHVERLRERYEVQV